MRWLVIIFFIATFFFPIKTSAVQGTCSWHAGVNCEAGADYDGSAICNDGWMDSSEVFTDQCPQYKPYALLKKAQSMCWPPAIPDYTERLFRYRNECYKPYSERANELIAQGGDAVSIMSSLRGLQQDCLDKAEQRLNEEMLNSTEYKTCVTDTSLTLFNSYYKRYPSREVRCDVGYILRNGACITHTEDCRRQFGDNIDYGVKSDHDGSICYCQSGYKWNDARTACIEKIVIPPPSPDPVQIESSTVIVEKTVTDIKEPTPTQKKEPQATKTIKQTPQDSPSKETIMNDVKADTTPTKAADPVQATTTTTTTAAEEVIEKTQSEQHSPASPFIETIQKVATEIKQTITAASERVKMFFSNLFGRT